MTDISNVISWKFNNQAGMSCRENSDGVVVIVEFPSDEIPDLETQKTWTAEYDAYVLANAYVGKRELEYPSIVEQLDDIYHNGIDAWKATIKVTKDKYPK